MSEINGQYFAIVDYGLGNLFSVKNACDVIGIQGVITSDGEEILNASGIFLPGVGAFNDAMKALESKDLIDPLNQCVRQKKIIIGICLGMQILMNESFEFGHHEGLGFIDGSVQRLEESVPPQQKIKIPHVGWNRIHCNPQRLHPSKTGACREDACWNGTPLEGISEGEFMYFVHSYYVKPVDPQLTVATTTYGKNIFCSVIQKGTIFGMQFHPEKSGPLGLMIYENIAKMVQLNGENSHD
jgi:imidazole glycerol-phosphate synthase subunit HisH